MVPQVQLTASLQAPENNGHRTPERTMYVHHINSTFCNAIDERVLDRDCALALGWVQNLLSMAILQLPEQKANMAVKIEAVSAVNKASLHCHTII